MIKHKGKLIAVPVLAGTLLLLFLLFRQQESSVVVSILPGDSEAEISISARLPFEQSVHSVTAFSAGGNQYYLFLPSLGKEKVLRFNADGHQVRQETAGGTSEKNEAKNKFSDLPLSNGLTFSIDGRYHLTLLTGSEIPSVFLTLKHDFSRLTADKAVTDSGSAAILSADGATLYSGDLQKIRGRGNTSWEQDKKPFNVELKDSLSLFDMRAASKYALISSSDRSFLRNRISHRMALQLAAFSIQRESVNLYINGEYQGIYEFCEKISPETLGIHDMEEETKQLNRQWPFSAQVTTQTYLDDWNRSVTGKWWDLPVEPPDITGGYILEADDSTRYAAEASGFTLDSGSYLVTKSPTYLTAGQFTYLSSYLQDCENTMIESVGKDRYDELATRIDIRSFEAKYLMEEVSKNIDCSASSQYFYKDRNGLLFAGPPWDYDWAYGVQRTYDKIDFSDPEGYSARDIPGAFVWWQLLYYNNAFYNDVTQTYRDTLYPWLSRLTEEELPAWEASLTDSAVMDYLRWGLADASSIDLQEIRQVYHEQVAAVADFITARQDFLYREWVEPAQ